VLCIAADPAGSSAASAIGEPSSGTMTLWNLGDLPSPSRQAGCLAVAPADVEPVSALRFVDEVCRPQQRLNQGLSKCRLSAPGRCAYVFAIGSFVRERQ